MTNVVTILPWSPLPQTPLAGKRAVVTGKYSLGFSLVSLSFRALDHSCELNPALPSAGAGGGWGDPWNPVAGSEFSGMC